MKKTLKLFILGFAVLTMSILLMNTQTFAATPVTDEAGLRAAVEAGGTVELGGDITIINKSSSTADGGRDRAAIVIDKDVTVDGKGYTISTSKIGTVFEIYEGVKVTFTNVTIKNTVAGGRCIDTRAKGIDLTLDNAHLVTEKTGTDHDQTLTIGGSHSEKISVMIKNESTITAGRAGYAIIVLNPVNLTINNSDVSGYAAIYLKGSTGGSVGSDGTVINVENGSVLNGINNNSGTSDNFGTIAFEDDGVEVNIKDSTIKATGTGSALQQIVSEDENLLGVAFTKGNSINVEGKSEVSVKEDGVISKTLTGKTKVVLGLGVKTDLNDNDELEKYLPEGTSTEKDKDGNVVVVKLYKVTVKEAKNGKITVSEKTFKAGDKVTVNAVPDKGYKLKGFSGVDKLEKVAEYGYEFTMPEKDVVLSAEFVSEAEKDDSPKTGIESTMLTVVATIAVVSLASVVVLRRK